jgi:hypothetical protein
MRDAELGIQQDDLHGTDGLVGIARLAEGHGAAMSGAVGPGGKRRTSAQPA